MQDTFISLGRGIDGVVGRMVDRVGDAGTGERSTAGENVELLRYIVVSVDSGRERVLHVDETLVTDGATGRDLDDRLLAPYATHVDREHLRVHTRVLRRWPRRSVPAPAERAPTARPVAEASRTAAESPRPKARPPKPPAPPRRDATPPAPEPAPAATETATNQVPPEELDRRLVEALAEADATGLSMGQLVKRTGERSATLRARLQHLGRDGTVLRAGDGLKTRYRLKDQ